MQHPRPDGPVSPAVTQQEPAPEDRQARAPAPAAGTAPVQPVPVPSAARPVPVATAARPEPVATAARPEPVALGTAAIALGASHVAAEGPGPAVAAIEWPTPGGNAAGLEPPTSRGPLGPGRPAPDAPVGPAANGVAANGVAAGASTQRPGSPTVLAPGGMPAADGHGGCTAAQLRRFIKSRAYVPLHELRRRFELDGDEDDVSPIDLGGRRLFVGLPDREARLLGELFEAGDVGYELLLDPTSPLVVGVFPMRPVPRA